MTDWAGPTSEELAALDDLGAGGDWRLGDRTVTLSNLDKVLLEARTGAEGEAHDAGASGDGAAAVTKRDLIRHYATMAPTLAPFLVDRPVNLHRFPNGLADEGFWQRAVPQGAPDWVQRWHNPFASGSTPRQQMVFDGAASLAWAANTAAIEIHPWTSTVHAADEPTYALVDIDPGPVTTWDDTVLMARLYRTALDELGLVARAKVTGQRGIQVWIPVRRGYSFDDTRNFVEFVSRAVGRTVPELVSWQWQTDRRRGRARLDYTQNAMNRTLVAPWSVRPAPGGPVSVPIEWDELDDDDLRPDRWPVAAAARRLASAGDPFSALVGVEQSLPAL